jgi:hypothetical protein
MTLKLQLNTCAGSSGSCFTKEQLQEIANALEVSMATPSGVGVSGAGGSIVPVYYGKDAPFNTCTPWQKVNECGEPIGRVKHFKGGVWV